MNCRAAYSYRFVNLSTVSCQLDSAMEHHESLDMHFLAIILCKPIWCWSPKYNVNLSGVMEHLYCLVLARYCNLINTVLDAIVMVIRQMLN